MTAQTMAGRRASPWLPRTLPFAAYMLFLAATPHATQWLRDGRWIYGIQIAAVSLLLLVFARGYEELWQAPRLAIVDVLTAIAAGIAVFVLWICLDSAPFVFGTARGFDPRDGDGNIVASLALVRTLGAALAVPVMEELFWRSLVMRRLDSADFLSLHPKACSAIAVLGSSVVFGLEHTLWFAGILAGLTYAWLYRSSGKLWSAIVAHAVTNLLLAIWVLATGNWQFW